MKNFVTKAGFFVGMLLFCTWASLELGAFISSF